MKKIEIKLKEKVLSIFPNSFVSVSESSLCGHDSIFIRFALGKDKSEFVSGIIQNDNCFTCIHISGIGGMMEVSLVVGGICVKSSNPLYHNERVKVGLRKVKTADLEKVVETVERYFLKLRHEIELNRENMLPMIFKLESKIL